MINGEFEKEDLYMADLISIIRGNREVSVRLDIELTNPHEVSAVESALLANRVIEHIDLSNKGIGRQIMGTLVEVVFRLPRLKTLNLSHNLIDGEALLQLARYVSHHPSIETIDLTDNRFASKDITATLPHFGICCTLLHINWGAVLLNPVCDKYFKDLRARNLSTFRADQASSIYFGGLAGAGKVRFVEGSSGPVGHGDDEDDVDGYV